MLQMYYQLPNLVYGVIQYMFVFIQVKMVSTWKYIHYILLRRLVTDRHVHVGSSMSALKLKKNKTLMGSVRYTKMRSSYI